MEVLKEILALEQTNLTWAGKTPLLMDGNITLRDWVCPGPGYAQDLLPGLGMSPVLMDNSKRGREVCFLQSTIAFQVTISETS